MPRGFCFCALFALAVLAAIRNAHADSLAVLNSLRSGVCRPARINPTPLSASRALRQAAERIAAGAHLRDALAKSHFRARSSRTLSATGLSGDEALRALVRERFCRDIGDPSLTQIGIAQHEDGVWIVLAQPFDAPALARPEQVAGEVLTFVNQARKRARHCGAMPFPPAPALIRSKALDTAAAVHARDMTKHDELTHRGSDGSTPGSRALKAGYRWRVIGENVAAGPESARQVVAGWLASPEHCANIMDARFREMGVAFDIDWGRESGIYWAQEFGLPLAERTAH